jgi:hypothetical protein
MVRELTRKILHERKSIAGCCKKIRNASRNLSMNGKITKGAKPSPFVLSLVEGLRKVSQQPAGRASL